MGGFVRRVTVVAAAAGIGLSAVTGAAHASQATLQAGAGNGSIGLSTSPGAGGPVGSTVTDTATLSRGHSATGTITFRLYGPSATANCSGAAVDTEQATVSGNGSYTTPAGATPAQVGTYWWTASYSGDRHNKPAASTCGSEQVTLVQASPGITTKQQPATVVVGSAVADQATVTGGFSPTGTVAFTLYDNNGCTGSPLFTDTENLSGGTATSATYTPAAPGTYYWTAAYHGDANNNPVASGCTDEPVAVVPASPGISTSQQPVTAVVGSAVADQATVTDGSAPTGTVTFTLYDNNGCTGSPLFTDTENLSGGTATSASYTPAAPGNYYWTAAYHGDADNNPVASGCADEIVTIIPALPGLSTTPSAGGAVGTIVTDTARLSGGDAPSGTITFSLYGPSAAADCGTTPVYTRQVTVSGAGIYATAGTTPAQAGNYWWTASYSGDTDNSANVTGCGDEEVTITGSNTVIVVSPGAQSTTVGTAVSLEITASDSQSSQALTYSATGLPDGLSINSSTGLISGTPTTAGSNEVTLTATDTTGAHGSASFLWVVSPPNSCTSVQLLGNPGFETGNAAPWTTNPGVINSNGGGIVAHSGNWFAWLDGYGTVHTDTLSQTVTIPASCSSSTFSFWLYITTAETSVTTAYDTLTVTANGHTLATFSNLNHSPGYIHYSYSLGAIGTGNVTIKFTGTEDNSLQTSFVIDDTALNTG